MPVIPGSHGRQLRHTDTHAPNNVVARGQQVTAAPPEALAVDLVLTPGQISLHHVLIVHGSQPNRSSERRIGLALRYVTPQVKQEGGSRDSAALVRGTDRYGHFELEPRPERDMEPQLRGFHREILKRVSAELQSIPPRRCRGE